MPPLPCQQRTLAVSHPLPGRPCSFSGPEVSRHTSELSEGRSLRRAFWGRGPLSGERAHLIVNSLSAHSIC